MRPRVRTEILDAYLADTCKARLLQPDGTWVRAQRKRRPGAALRAAGSFTAQKFLVDVAEGNATLDAIPIRRPKSRTRTRSERTTAE